MGESTEMGSKIMTALLQQDIALLTELQKDCRISNQELADRTAMSASACWRRVRSLEAAGIIKGYAALVDAEKAGLGFSAIVHVSLTRHDRNHVDTFISEISDRREVLECLATTGDADYHLRVVCQDQGAYNAFLDDFLFRLPGIANVKTNLVLKEIKLDTSVPV